MRPWQKMNCERGGNLLNGWFYSLHEVPGGQWRLTVFDQTNSAEAVYCFDTVAVAEAAVKRWVQGKMKDQLDGWTKDMLLGVYAKAPRPRV